jgi:MFS family permease
VHPHHEAPPAHNLRAVLGGRGMRRLLAVRFISQMGDGWFQAGLAGSVLFNPDQRASPIEIAAGFAVLLLPYSLVGPYVGVFLDRWNRRSVLVTANLIRAALVAPAVALIWSGNEDLPFLTAALLIIGLNRFFVAGLTAAVPHVVEDRRLVTANALAGVVGSTGAALGLGIAVALLDAAVPASFHGYAVIASFALGAYVLSAVLARVSFSATELGPDLLDLPHSTVWTELRHSGRDMLAGLRHLVGHSGALYAMLAQAGHRILVGVVAVSTILFSRAYVDTDDLAGSAPVLGALLAAGGLGLMAGALLTPPVTRRLGGWRWITILLLFEGVVVAATGLAGRPEIIALGAFGVNFASAGIKIVVETDVQHETADEYRGRVFSLNDTVFNISFVLGLFVAAYAAPPSGRSVGELIGLLIGFVIVAGWYAAVGGRWASRVGDDIAEPQRSTPAVALIRDGSPSAAG